VRSYDLNGTIIYNGKSSVDLGVIVNKLPVIRKPKRKGSTTSIPGRSGSLAREEGGFENYVQPYEISITDTNRGISAISGDLAAWLLNTRGYIRLEDSFDPDVYRMARFEGPFDIEPLMEQDGTAVIEFDCQPQRYLKSGEQEISLSNGETTLYNPTVFASSPLIRVDMALEGITEEEPVTPVNVALEFTDGKYIGNSNVAADNVHRVIDIGYSNFNKVSQAIDVSNYQTAIITAECYYESVHGTHISGLASATCYTFLDANGEPCGGITDCHELKAVSVPIPQNAKWLHICVYYTRAGEEPAAVTLIPTPPRVGSGKVTINGKTSAIRFTDRSTIYLDCEAHDAYYADGSNANAAVSFREDGNNYATFPNLDPGDNLVTIDGDGVTATIRPRWWTL